MYYFIYTHIVCLVLSLAFLRFLSCLVVQIQLERMLASHAFTLPVARTEVTTNGYREGHTSDAAYGYHDRNGSLPSSDCRGGRSSGNVVEYTRSGAVLGRGRGYRAPGISSQVG